MEKGKLNEFLTGFFFLMTCLNVAGCLHLVTETFEMNHAGLLF